jgi:hypothetical protein
VTLALEKGDHGRKGVLPLAVFNLEGKSQGSEPEPELVIDLTDTPELPLADGPVLFESRQVMTALGDYQTYSQKP